MAWFTQQRAQFNRRVTNPAFLPISGYLPLWSIVEHTGRRSGTSYRTPVTMFRAGAGLAVLLPYGWQRDWVKNLQHAGGGRVKFTGRTFAVDQPRVVPTAEALPLLKSPWRQIAARSGVEHTLLLRRAD